MEVLRGRFLALLERLRLLAMLRGSRRIYRLPCLRALVDRQGAPTLVLVQQRFGPPGGFLSFALVERVEHLRVVDDGGPTRSLNRGVGAAVLIAFAVDIRRHC